VAERDPEPSSRTSTRPATNSHRRRLGLCGPIPGRLADDAQGPGDGFVKKPAWRSRWPDCALAAALAVRRTATSKGTRPRSGSRRGREPLATQVSVNYLG